MVVYVDMDEVLSDFILSACEAHEVDRELVDENRINGEWCIVPAIARALKIPEQEFTTEVFWKPIKEQGVDFWANMAETPWFDSIIKSLNTFNFEWHVLSAPTEDVDCYTGKAIWLKERFGLKFDKFIFTPHKYVLANSGCVLIDDKEDNVKKFSQVGGKSILFPHLGNRLHKVSSNPWDYVESYLQEMTN